MTSQIRFDPEARAWVTKVIGAPVTRVRPLHGGVSSSMHRIDTARGSYVLRRVPRPPEPGDHPADDIRREALTLDLLAGHPLVPSLVAADPDGGECGMPASLQTLLPGRPDSAPRRLDLWLDGLADAIALAATSGVDAAGHRPYRSWIPADASLPAWATDLEAWRAAIEACADGPPPGGPTVLVHRDLHPANVLFRRGRLTGVVDWVNACRGPAQVDVSKCRVEVAFLAGIDAADALLARCGDLAQPYDALWDAYVVLECGQVGVGFLAFNRFGSRLTLEGIHATLDAVLIRAMRSR